MRQHAGDDVDPLPERGLQRLRLLPRGTAVLRLDRARTLEPEQRQDGGGGEHHLDPPEPVDDGRQTGQVTGRHLLEGQAAGAQHVTLPRAQRRQQPRSGVVHGGAGEADDDAPRFGGQGQEEQLTEAEGRGMPGVPGVGVDQVGSARLRRLDVGGPRPVDVHDEDGRGYRLAGGTVDRGGEDLSAEGVSEDVEEAGTAVRHRREDQVVVRGRGRPAPGHRLGRLPGGQGPGEPGRGEDDAHTVMLAGPRSTTELRCLALLVVAGARTDRRLSPVGVGTRQSAGLSASGAAQATLTAL